MLKILVTRLPFLNANIMDTNNPSSFDKKILIQFRYIEFLDKEKIKLCVVEMYTLFCTAAQKYG